VRVGPRLPRRFFARSATAVAPDLLGRVLVRMLPDGTRLSVRLVEVEAYGPDDPASHAFGGRTSRNAVMFGSPGHLYVYFTYGLHFCANVVTESAGVGSAVLLRAAEPLEGLEVMASNRGVDAARLLCSGPARLAQALGLDRTDDGTDLVRGRDLHLRAGEPIPSRRIARTTRVGVRMGTRERWRYFERGSPFVSPARPAATIRGSPGS
jgi:DNA-3-methyladenine glycosylase